MVKRLDPKEAARVRTEAAATLTQAMTRTKDPGALGELAQGLSDVAPRLEPKEAARVSAQVAATLTQAMTKTKDSDTLQSLVNGLSVVVNFLEPKEAAEAAATLTEAMTKTNDPNALGNLAQGLSAVSGRLDPKEAARVSAQAAAALTQAMTKTNAINAFLPLGNGLWAVSDRLEPKGAAEAAATLMQAMTKEDSNPEILAGGLSKILDDNRWTERAGSVAAAVGCFHQSQWLPALVLLQSVAEPFPRPLSNQELVELLKQPFSVGPARRAILDQLGHRYQRPFADQSDFVRFAEEQKLGLDFSRRPQRP